MEMCAEHFQKPPINFQKCCIHTLSLPRVQCFRFVFLKECKTLYTAHFENISITIS